MIKIISAIAISAYITAALFIFPGFAPQVEAGLALAKGDRLPSLVVVQDCSQQMWPNFSVDCLHGKEAIHEVRLISARG
jgi:hypothetical protein